ncbi:MAG: helix-turn-helix domain-containing protein [Candidatus Eisenbacteria sp.]|nr:helix-turn-helix domain-containing protein [Candidatus Eisenbacteria bacterium]
MSEDLELLRPSDLAPMMGVTTSRVYQMIKAGVLPAIRVAGSIRVPREAWQRWLDSQRDKALEAVRKP